MTPSDVRAHAEDLQAKGLPFVMATVVRAERPTSGKPGDRAIVHSDGTIIGFVGGECAQASVRTQALAALERGEPVLLRIMPDDATSGGRPQQPAEGVVTVHNPCLSGGTLEIFLEPTQGKQRLAVYGSSPIATALSEVARHAGYDVDIDGEQLPDAVVVASHGDNEAEPLISAVRRGVRYVGLVASRRRGPQVLEALELTDDEKERIHTPAGLDIKARTPDEVAISILAEIIATRAQSSIEIPRQEATDTAVDPVCGMTVAAVEATLHADTDGVRYWFCSSGCHTAFTANPSAFATR